MVTCGLSNLATCLPEKALFYFISLLNQAVEPLLNIILRLITSKGNIEVFFAFWQIEISSFSLLYGLSFLWSGISFLYGGSTPQLRYLAKESLKNTFLMIIFMQMSYYLYSLFLEFIYSFSSGVLSLLDKNFFLLSVDSFSSASLQFLFLIPYVLSLLIVSFLFMLRYMLLSFGVILLPFAVYFFFLLPFRSFARLFFTTISIFALLPVFSSLVLFATQKLVFYLPNLKVLLITTAFLFISFSSFALILFTIIKSAVKILSTTGVKDLYFPLRMLK